MHPEPNPISSMLGVNVFNLFGSYVRINCWINGIRFGEHYVDTIINKGATLS